MKPPPSPQSLPLFRTLLLVCIGLPFFAKAQPVQNFFLAKPYLQIGERPEPGSIEILWQTVAEASRWSVEVKQPAEQNWRACPPPQEISIAPLELAPRTLYRCRVEGLDPNSAFQYRLLRNDSLVFEASGKAIRSGDQPYRYVVFGDIGAGTRDSKLIAMGVRKTNADLAVVPGDIIYDRGRLTEYDLRFWPIYNADSLSREGAPLLRSIPFVAAPGNHDTEERDFERYPDALAYFLLWSQPLNGPARKTGGPAFPSVRMGRETKKRFLSAAGKRFPSMANFSFDYGNAHWLILDANNYVEWNVRSLRQWVEADLLAAKDKRWKFVVFHQPGFSSSHDHFEQQQMRLLAPAFEKGGADLVFMGHVHNYQRSFPIHFKPDGQGYQLLGGREGLTPRGRRVDGRWTVDTVFDGKEKLQPNGVIYIVTGAGGQILYDIDQEKNPASWQTFTTKFISSQHSFTVVDVDGDSLELKQLSVDGAVLDSIRIHK